MAYKFRSRSLGPRPVRSARPARTATPPGVVVDAVLRFHDEAQDQGGGRTLLRLSASRLRDADVKAALGDLTARAATVSILWNEREGEIIRVLAA